MDAAGALEEAVVVALEEVAVVEASEVGEAGALEEAEEGAEEDLEEAGEAEEGEEEAVNSKRAVLMIRVSAPRSRSLSRVCPRVPRCPSWSSTSPRWARSRWTETASSPGSTCTRTRPRGSCWARPPSLTRTPRPSGRRWRLTTTKCIR